jgi:hypothetical protein
VSPEPEALAGIGGAARALPGYLGEEVFRPAGGSGGEYRIVYRFDSPAHLRGWLDSRERAAWLARAGPHVASPMRTQVLTGLEGWFTLPRSPARTRRPYQMAVLTGVTISPLTTTRSASSSSSRALQQHPPATDTAAGPGKDTMHPMFKELFIETDVDDLPAEEDRRRRVRRSRRARSAMVIRPAARHRQRQPRS